jgi:protease I
MATHILVITGDAGESFECLYARQRFLEAGLVPHIAAPSKRRLHLVIHDFEPGWDTYVERPGYGAEADLTFDQVRVEAYGAVLVLGGRAPEYLRHDPRVLAIVRAFDEAGKWVWAICHGVQVLAAADLIRDRRVTAYAHCRWELEAAGATYVASDQAVRDGRLVTGQTWESHPEFYREVFACLAEGRRG